MLWELCMKKLRYLLSSTCWESSKTRRRLNKCSNSKWTLEPTRHSKCICNSPKACTVMMDKWASRGADFRFKDSHRQCSTIALKSMHPEVMETMFRLMDRQVMRHPLQESLVVKPRTCAVVVFSSQINRWEPGERWMRRQVRMAIMGQRIRQIRHQSRKMMPKMGPNPCQLKGVPDQPSRKLISRGRTSWRQASHKMEMQASGSAMTANSRSL